MKSNEKNYTTTTLLEFELRFVNLACCWNGWNQYANIYPFSHFVHITHFIENNCSSSNWNLQFSNLHLVQNNRRPIDWPTFILCASSSTAGAINWGNQPNRWSYYMYEYAPQCIVLNYEKSENGDMKNIKSECGFQHTKRNPKSRNKNVRCACRTDNKWIDDCHSEDKPYKKR